MDEPNQTDEKESGWWAAALVSGLVCGAFPPLGILPIGGYALYRGYKRMKPTFARWGKPLAVRAARQRYEQRLHMIRAAGLDAGELLAAQLQAKQHYLVELDGLIHDAQSEHS